MDGYRIVQISDLHNAKFGQNNEKLIRKIAGLEPDMIVVSGDLVDSNHTDLDVAIHFMESVTQICPVYYVTGNHEYWLDDRSLSDGTLSSLMQDCDSDCLRVVLAHEPQYRKVQPGRSRSCFVRSCTWRTVYPAVRRSFSSS